jgi:hypothetical protein
MRWVGRLGLHAFGAVARDPAAAEWFGRYLPWLKP